jgi:hypothetical protein
MLVGAQTSLLAHTLSIFFLPLLVWNNNKIARGSASSRCDYFQGTHFPFPLKWQNTDQTRNGKRYGEGESRRAARRMDDRTIHETTTKSFYLSPRKKSQGTFRGVDNGRSQTESPRRRGYNASREGTWTFVGEWLDRCI